MPLVVSGGVTQTPAVRTLAQLQTQVLRYIGMPDHTEAQAMAMDEINNAIGDLNRRNWYWAVTSDDLTMVAGTSDYNLTADFSAPRMAHWLDTAGSPAGKVSYLSPKDFDERLQYGGVGTPIAYAVYNFTNTGQLSLDVPISAAAVASYPKLRVRYFARVPTLVNASDTLPVPSEVEQYVIWQARLVCCLSTDENSTRCSRAAAMAQKYWDSLVLKDCTSAHRDWE